MPRMMTVVSRWRSSSGRRSPTCIIDYTNESRRIYTDGRDWPKERAADLRGYSIGKWIDEDGDGRYDVLEVETRGFKGPRTFRRERHPELHDDNQTVVKERIYLDKANRERPARRDHHDRQRADPALDGHQEISRASKPDLDSSTIAPRATSTSRSARRTTFCSADGHLMPARKDQPPPDLRYFNQAGR